MTDRSRFGPDTLYPAVQFPVYGLDSLFPGPRWLALFGDPPDGAPTWVTLDHQSADGRSLIRVTTHVRRAAGDRRIGRLPTDEQAAQEGRSPLEDVASQCTVALIDMTLPVQSRTRPPGFLRALVARAGEAATAYSRWPTASWRVDGARVRASVWRFAGGWAGFTDAAAGVYLVVVGVGPGTGPEDLSFAALRDSSAYHFDVQGPLSLQMVQTSAEAAGVQGEADPSWQHQDWHPDQVQVMRELGQETAS